MNKNTSPTTDQDEAHEAESMAHRMLYEAMSLAAAGDAFAIEWLPEFRKAWLTAYFARRDLEVQS